MAKTLTRPIGAALIGSAEAIMVPNIRTPVSPTDTTVNILDPVVKFVGAGLIFLAIIAGSQQRNPVIEVFEGAFDGIAALWGHHITSGAP